MSLHSLNLTIRHLPWRVEKLRLVSSVGLFFLFLIGACDSWAQALYWDTNGAAAGAGSSPSATWSTSSGDKNWTINSAGTVTTIAWTDGRDALFSAGTDATGSYTTTVSGTVSTSSVTVQKGNPTFSGGVVNFSDSTPDIVVASGSTLTFNSQIAGSNGITKSGAGTLIVGNTSNAYTGDTTVSAGTLMLGATNTLPTTTALTVASGALFDFNWGNSQTIGSLSGAGTVNTRGANLTIGDATSTTFPGVLGDNGAYGGLVKQGTGTLTLSGANTFTGLTTINAGALTVANNSALGGSTYGNIVASGAALNLTGGVTLTEGSVTASGTGLGNTGAIRNLGGTNTYAATLNLGAATTVGSDAGTLTVSGSVSNAGYATTIVGAGNVTITGAVTGSGGFTQNGTGTLTLSGSAANSFGGTLAVNSGVVALAKTAGTNTTGGGAIIVGDSVGAAGSAVLRLDASNQIPDYTTSLTINSDGKFSLNNQSEAIDVIGGVGQIDTGTSGSLKIGVNSGSSSFAGTIAGSGTVEKTGSGTLTFNTSINFNSGTLILSGGTLALNGYNLNVGTLNITGNTVLDFGNSSASILNANLFAIAAGVTVTITNWTGSIDYFYAQNWTGATLGTSGGTTTSQVVFTGYSGSQTNWQKYDNQITPIASPVPEPAAYGALFTAAAISLSMIYRRRSSPANSVRA